MSRVIKASQWLSLNALPDQKKPGPNSTEASLNCLVYNKSEAWRILAGALRLGVNDEAVLSDFQLHFAEVLLDQLEEDTRAEMRKPHAHELAAIAAWFCNCET